jgi:hypothetical protein
VAVARLFGEGVEIVTFELPKLSRPPYSFGLLHFERMPSDV